MLYLNPPYPIIRGTALFSDHQDPLQWYYMPAVPRLSTIPDLTTNVARPALQMIKFRGDAGAGGFLNFDVNVGLDENALDDIKSELRSPQYKLPQGAIKLSPVPLVGGTVKLQILGQESPSPSPTKAPTSTSAPADPNLSLPKFITKISHDAHPSLYGDNQASFSVMLDQYGVTILEQALAGNMAPIGVVYSLDFLGLRPAYSVHLRIDWDRVQKHMDEHFGANLIFVSVDIDKAIDELIENRAIVLESDLYVPEGEDDSSVIGSHDRAMNELRDMITEAFFKPSIDPTAPLTDRTVDKVAGVCRAIGSGGMIPSFSYSKFDYTRIDKKVLDANMRERTTVKRSIYPQGHLTGLLQVLRDKGLSMRDFVTEANLNDPWFQRRKIAVISRANFDADSISSIDVKLSYGNEIRDVVLEKQNPRQEVKWLSQVKDGVVEMPVAYEYQVNFQGVDGSERPLMLKSQPQTTSSENLEIEPRAQYSIVPIPVAVANPAAFPWSRYPRIEVHCEYQDADNRIHDWETIRLDKENTSKVWNLFTQNSAQIQFRYSLTYRAADNKDYESAARLTDGREVMVRDPFPSKRSVLVVPPGNWGMLDQVFADLVYEDKRNDFRQDESFSFSQNDRANKSFVVDLRDTSQRRVGFRVTFVDKNGGVFEVPMSYTLDNRLILRSDMHGHRIITIKANKVSFDERKLRELRVELRYADNEADLHYSGEVTLKSPLEEGCFEFDFVDAAKSRYEYRVTANYRNGMVQDSDWKSYDGDDLNVEL